jgi:hypothetical protein
MMDSTLHPNTRAMLSAWQHLEAAPQSAGRSALPSLTGGWPGVKAEGDFTGLMGKMFAIERVSEADFCFRLAGAGLETLMGRQLAEQNFLGLFRDHDRTMMSALIEATGAGHAYGMARALGESIEGKRLELEIAIAPLDAPPRPAKRFLGLVQPLGGERLLAGRPLTRLRLTAIYPPRVSALRPRLRVVERA